MCKSHVCLITRGKPGPTDHPHFSKFQVFQLLSLASCSSLPPHPHTHHTLLSFLLSCSKGCIHSSPNPLISSLSLSTLLPFHASLSSLGFPISSLSQASRFPPFLACFHFHIVLWRSVTEVELYCASCRFCSRQISYVFSLIGGGGGKSSA